MRRTIIIPAHNEGTVIQETLASVCKTFPRETEIIVVPNGCVDDTREKSEAFARTHKQVRVILLPGKGAKGGAILVGYHHAQGEQIAFLDADLATSPTELHRLFDEMGENDGIIGSRWMKGSVIVQKQPWTRILASRVFNLMNRALFGLPYHDTQCGAKILTREAVQYAVDRVHTPGWAFDVDLLYTLKKGGFRIREVPITWKDRAESKLKLSNTVAKMFLAMIRLRVVHSPVNALHQRLKPVTRILYQFAQWVLDRD